ncbi:P-loop containing nucleoside triphosphate hydrolase protein, partial [Aspergillus aculeatinus CBS 121060]
PSSDQEPGDRSRFALTIHNASFSYPGSSSAVLQNITVNIPRSQLTQISGPVGSGKSALLRAMLGEMDLLRGSVEKNVRNPAYCHQSPWLLNSSIRENIVGPDQDLDIELYRKALWACELDHDLREIIEGDHTKVGSSGVTLSGGQKQRIAMARAVYARKELFLLDYSFSALDPRTEGKVARRLLGPKGMMRENGQTVVAASNGEWLLPYADRIILLDTNGRIRAQGSPEELASHFTIPSKGNNKKDDDVYISHQEALSVSNTSSDRKVQQTELGEHSSEHRNVPVYRSYFRSMGFWRGMVLCALLILQTFFSKFPTVWLQWWLDKDPSSMGSSYAKYIGVYSLFHATSMIFTLLAAFQQLRIVMPQTSRYFHSRLLTAAMGMPMPAFSKIDTGSIINNRFSQDLQLIDWNLPVTFLNASEGALATLAQVIIIASSFPYIFIAFPVLFAVVLAIQRFYLHTSKQVRAMDIEAKSPLLDHFLETINGLHTVRAFGWQHHIRKRHDALLNASQRPYYQRFMVQRWLNLVLDMVAAGVAILVVGLSIRLQTRSTLVGLALVNVISLNETLQLLILQWAVMEISLGSITRLEEFTVQARTDRLLEQQSNFSVQAIGGLWPPHGSIEYKNVTARYQDGGPDVLKNICLSIPAGSKVGVCGRTGSGKSTLISALFQMIDLTSGCIVIDGVDIAELDPESVRSHLIGISQHSYIMPGISVRDNLQLGCVNPSEDSQLIAALQKVNLWGLVSERGGLSAILDNETMSAGQSQLFTCARALLRSGSVVVLDEPASSLTAETADLIQRVILEEFKERTVIAVMHQIERLLDFDTVVVMGDGRVLEMGQPRELQEGNGLFRGLLDASQSSR